MKLLAILFLLKTKSEGKYSESRLQCVILEKKFANNTLVFFT